ncbi:hypothetical protein ACHAWF_008477 [Thalassiosira exigua]
MPKRFCSHFLRRTISTISVETMADIPAYNPSYVKHDTRNREEYAIGMPEITDAQQNGSVRATNASARQVGGAAVAGTVAGLAVSGPVVGVAAGGAAAYAATRHSGMAGGAARQTGDAVATAGEKAKELNDRHEITKRSIIAAKSAIKTARDFDEKHQIVNKTKEVANSAVLRAREVDQKHQVTDKSKKAASSAISKAKDIDEKHHVTEKTKVVALATTKKVALGVKFISKSLAGNKAANGVTTS